MKIDLLGNTIKIDDFADNTEYRNGTIILTNVVPPNNAYNYNGVRLIDTTVVYEKKPKEWAGDKYIIKPEDC